MSQRLPIHVLGLGAEGLESLSKRACETLCRASFVAGGRRHLALVNPDRAETFVVGSNLESLVERLRLRGVDERCVVLASGDPLCFGIGRLLGDRLDRGSLVFEPALTSLQLAFARVGRSWNDASIASIHGRPHGPALLPLLGRPLIGLFTHDGASPAAVSEFFVSHGLDDYDAWVGENLGGHDERVTCHNLPDLAGLHFSDLNFLVLERRGGVEETRPVIPRDDDFSGPAPGEGPRLLTHRDVRSIALSRFEELAEGPVWDLGAGLGGMAVALANHFVGREVVAVERSPRELIHLSENRKRFHAWNLRIVPGAAPEALDAEPAPAAVFLGGSGGRLDAILDLVLARLSPGGRLVGNFVGLENLARTLSLIRAAGWHLEITQVQINPAQDLAGLTSFVPLRPVWILSTTRPG